MTTFKIYDAMMGSGKTTHLISEIKESHINQKFIYIAPLLSECHRIAGTIFDKDDIHKRPITVEFNDTSILYAYSENAPLKDKNFKHPYFSENGGKAESLPVLLQNNDNIVSTHQLFMNLTPEILEKAKDYILIVDETMTVYEPYDDYKRQELEQMFLLEWIYIDTDTLTVRFNRNNFGNNGGDPKNTRYETFATMCDLGQLLYVDNKLVVWELAVDTLKCFKEVWIATYMFEGSQMSAYLKNHGLDYELIRFGNKPSSIKHLVNLNIETRINAIGNRPTSLSSSDYTKNKRILCEIMAKHLYNYFGHKQKAKQHDRMWTSFKMSKSSIGINRYQDDFLAFNTKATNDYAHIHNVAYLLNLYPNPMLVKAAAIKGNSIKEDIFALSEMVQFIWRSAIRNGEVINLYVPSSRMRNLLIRWLNDEFEDKQTVTQI